MGEWRNQFRRGLVALLTLAVAGGTASAVSRISLENSSVEDESLIKVSLEDIEDTVQGEAAVSQEQSQAVAYASDGKGLKSNDAAIYNALKTCIQQVARGEKTSTEFSLRTKMSEAALAKVDVNTIVSYLLNDCPFDLYWHDKTRTVEDGKETDGVYCKYYKDGRIIFSFKVAQDYRNTPDDLYTVNSAYMENVNRAVQKAKSIVDTNQGNTDYDKLLNYRNAICDLVYYDESALYDPSYGNSYQVISVFDDDIYSNVVCEGYAKAFKYLCDMSSFDNDIECYTVSGVTDAGAGAGEHMWNVVRIGGKEGESYLVDVTNCDTGTIGEATQLFMTDQLAGSVDTGYTYSDSDSWSSITYQYSADAKEIYGNQILSLENAGHNWEAQTHVPGDNNNIMAADVPDDTTTTTKPTTVTVDNNSANNPSEDSSGQQEEGDSNTTGFAFGVTEVEKVYGDDAFTETVPGYDGSKTIKYSSSDTTVAEVSKRGKVEIKNAGTTVIKAECDGKEATYTLKVSPKKLNWDTSELYAIDRASDITGKAATLYGEIKLEGLLPGDKDKNSQFSFDGKYLTGTYSEITPGIQTVTLAWRENKEVRLSKSTKTANYEMPDALPEIFGKITSIRELPEPEFPNSEIEDWVQYKLEMEDGITVVPPGLAKLRDLDTPPKIEAALKEDLKENGIQEENVVVYDVSLYWQEKVNTQEDDEEVQVEIVEDFDQDFEQEQIDSAKTSNNGWAEVSDEYFPEGGVTITLPYPDGMPRNVDEIVISHMFGEDMYTSSPGEIEHPSDIEQTVDGIKFTVSGLSPIAVGWRAAGDGTEQTEIQSPETIESPTQTTDNNQNTGTGQQNNQNGQNGSNKSPVTGDTIQIMIYAVLILLCAAVLKGIQAIRSGKKK